MKRRTFLEKTGSALALAAAGIAGRRNASGRTPAERKVLALERDWLDAMVRRDEPTLQKLVAEDFQRIEKETPNISMYKPQWITNTVRWTKVDSFKYSGMHAEGAGRDIKVTVRYRWRGTLGETPFNETVTAVDTWTQKDGRWQVTHRMVESADKAKQPRRSMARRKAIKVDPAIYAAYVGRYRFSASRILTISRDGDRLMHQGSGGHRAELFPETQTRFFRKDAGVLTTFVQDKTGRVTHLMHVHASGRQSIARRIA